MSSLAPHLNQDTLSSETSHLDLEDTIHQDMQQNMEHILQTSQPLRFWFPISLMKAWDELYQTHLTSVIDYCGQPKDTNNGCIWNNRWQLYTMEVLNVTTNFIEEFTTDTSTPEVQVVIRDFRNKLGWEVIGRILDGYKGFKITCPLLGIHWMVDMVNKFTEHEAALAEVSLLL